MKILLYSDLHISRTSSILPTTYKDTKFTYRQQMVMNTGKWLANIAKKEMPNLIINLGDTFDQHTLTSYDTELARIFFSEFNDVNIPHFIVIGNHEMINKDFNAVAMLDNVNGISIIKDPISLNFKDTTLAFLPYNDYRNINILPEGDFLFSHNDIQGSSIRDNIVLPSGIDRSELSKYKLVFNGHIHKHSIFNNIVNVGSCTTHSFSDDNNSIPKAFIFDTETLNLNSYNNTYCPLFRSYEINDITEFNTIINNLDKNYEYILHITCPYEVKEEVKDTLEKLKIISKQEDNTLKDFIINYKLNVKVNKAQKDKLQECKEINKDIKTNLDVIQSFKEFLGTVDLKYPVNMYMDILK